MMIIRQKRPGPEAQFVVPDLVVKLTMTQCFRNGLSIYIGWWAGTTTLCYCRLYPQVRDYELGYI
jgi:hypothetical protein